MSMGFDFNMDLYWTKMDLGDMWMELFKFETKNMPVASYKIQNLHIWISMLHNKLTYRCLNLKGGKVGPHGQGGAV